MIVIVMGVSGAGKSLIGERLAERLSCRYVDGDALHSAANRDKMHRGIPLTDDDRWPWLHAIHAEIAIFRQAGRAAVLTCSALKRAYRDVLRNGDADVRFVYLQGSFDVLKARLAARSGHFFDPALLQSQLDTLEVPGPDEAIEISIEQPPDEIVERAIRLLGLVPHDNANDAVDDLA